MPFAARICLWHPLVTFLFITALFTAECLLGAWVRSRLTNHSKLMENQETGGILFNIVGVLYAVMVASLAVGVWEQFNQATQIAEQEAGNMLAVVRLAKAHPNVTPAVEGLKISINRYAHLVMEKEYPAMSRMENSPETYEAFQEVWKNAASLNPRTVQEGNIQQAIFAFLGDAQRDRVARLLAADRGLPESLWVVLAVSSAIVVGFSLFFSTEQRGTQCFVLGAVVLTASLVIFAVAELNYPFIGHLSVSPEGWTLVLGYSQ